MSSVDFARWTTTLTASYLAITAALIAILGTTVPGRVWLVAVHLTLSGYGRFHYVLDTPAGTALAIAVVVAYRYLSGDGPGEVEGRAARPFQTVPSSKKSLICHHSC